MDTCGSPGRGLGSGRFRRVSMAMQQTFLEIHEAGKVRRLPMGEDPVTVGRHSDNRVVITDSMASRFHCVISKGSEGFQLRDLNSSNGTVLNGKVVRVAKVSPGDAVTIGKARLVLIGPNGQVAQPPSSDKPRKSQPAIAPPPPDVNLDMPEPLPDDLGEELADPLTDEDIVSDDEVPATAQGDGSLGSVPMEGAVDTDLVAAVRDPADVVESLAESLPEKPFGEADIAMINSRGQVVHASGHAPTRGNRDAVDWFRLLLLLASRSHATDMHMEPKGDSYTARMRIDGTMVEVCKLSNALGSRLSALVKVMCEIDISQRNAIQEGHFSSRVPAGRPGHNRRIDYRISFAPSVYGQKLVIRVLDASHAPLQIGSLHLPDWMRKEIEGVVRQDAGMVLVCGPTGSGKTTTLYALLRSSDVTRRNVVTIEDPVEIQIEGVTQIPVDADQDRSFSNLLRSTLRQDPDVILIGEIRDAETARIAMQASVTGHLVFSTVHTQNTIGTIFRLLDLGVEPYLVAQALHVVLAQRLVRQLCPYCKLAVKPSPEQIQRMGPLGENLSRIFAPRGCPRCLHTGFAGRRAIFELLSTTDQLRELIVHTPTTAQIQTALASSPFRRLHQSGYDLVAQGISPFEEVDRAVGREGK